jgi:bla regulator protein blaR1
MRPDGQPTPRRYSSALVASLAVHVVVLAAFLSWAGARPTGSIDAGRGQNRDTTRRSPAPVPGLGGGHVENGEPPPAQVVATWPVREADRLGLRLGAGHVIDHVWQSTLFATGAGLLTLAFRRNRARVRYALWFSVSVKFLVPLSSVVWLGSFAASSGFLGSSDRLRIAGSLGPPPLLDALDSSSTGTPVYNLTRHPLIRGLGQSVAPMGTAALWPSTFTVTNVTLTWVSLALLGIWVCGFCAVVASRIRRSHRYWEVVLTSRRVELIDIEVPGRLQVALADGLLEPGVIGWVHPVLLLPADIERHLTRPQIEAIIAHELCHVRRFDNMTAATHMVVEAIFWFHPLVWWLGGRLVDERERACDEHVLSTVDASSSYAQGILNICERYAESPLASISGVRSANLPRRIDAILANRVGETTGVWKKLLLSAVIMCVVIVPLAAGALQAPAAASAAAISH